MGGWSGGKLKIVLSQTKLSLGFDLSELGNQSCQQLRFSEQVLLLGAMCLICSDLAPIIGAPSIIPYLDENSVGLAFKKPLNQTT